MGRELVAEPDWEDRKPQSDEARSAFAPPSGVAAAFEDESHTTSEFAIPEGLAPPEAPSAEPEGSAFNTPRTYRAPAFTPPTGIPVVQLTREVPWQDRMRTMLRMPVADRPVVVAHSLMSSLVAPAVA